MDEFSEYIGKHLLVGLSYTDDENVVTMQLQFHGWIVRIADDGIFVNRADGNGEFSLPPDVSSLQPAGPGNYKLRSTGEVVVNLDYICSWTIHAPALCEDK